MMVTDDVIFYSSLILCISLGNYYKKIEDSQMKRNYGTGLGILVACLIGGHNIFHTVFMVWGNIIIIKCSDRRIPEAINLVLNSNNAATTDVQQDKTKIARAYLQLSWVAAITLIPGELYVHQLSLAYTWLYLLYIHWNVQKSCYFTWLHQTIALRLVGLAFEISTFQRIKVEPTTRKTSTTKFNTTENEITSAEPSAGDVISYAFYFTGIHKGPYYRWKVFEEHFTIPFGTLGDCRIITEQKLKKAIACSLAYILLRLKYSPQMYYEKAFYTNYGSDFRYLYNIPQLTMFFLQYQIVMFLCTSVCTEAGFGMYPSKCIPIPGYGPSSRYSLLKLASRSPDVGLEEEYSFSMLKCFKNDKLLFGPRMKDTLRSWDMPTRFWFWAYMYKNFVKANKEVRSACSFVAWSIWVGPSLPQIIISSTLWVYVHLESEYSELYDVSGSMKIPWDIGFSIMRVFCLIYLTPCLIISDISSILKYYNSIYWIFHFVLLFLIIVAIAIFKLRDNVQ